MTSYTIDERDCEPSQHLLVMSFNIRYENNHKQEAHWTERREQVLALMQQSQADIICLQEVLHRQFTDVEEGMAAYEMHGVGREDARIAGEAVPILFKRERFSLQRVGHFWLSETPDQAGSTGWGARIPRMVTWVLLFDHASQRELLVCNAHMDHQSTQARNEGAKLLAQRMKDLRTFAANPDNVGLVICGDFNCSSTDEPHGYICNDASGIKNAHLTHYDGSVSGTYHGFNGKPTTAFIDWILHSTQLRCESALLHQDNLGGNYPSDHFPISAILHYQP